MNKYVVGLLGGAAVLALAFVFPFFFWLGGLALALVVGIGLMKGVQSSSTSSFVKYGGIVAGLALLSFIVANVDLAALNLLDPAFWGSGMGFLSAVAYGAWNFFGLGSKK